MTGGLLGQQLSSAGDICLAEEGETPLSQQVTADVPSNMQLNLHLLLLEVLCAENVHLCACM